MAKPFVWYRGATFRMALEVTVGAVTGDEPIRCAMRRSIGREPIGDEVIVWPGGTRPAPIFVAAEGAAPARWEFVSSADDADDLEPGHYIADARIEIEEDVIITKSVVIVVRNAATAVPA